MSLIIAALAVSGGIGSASAQSAGAELALEEIIVTAQRREQSLQEVPISVEAITGAQIHLQGYRDLNELGNFSPSVYIDDSDFLSQDRSIRGFGTSGNALTLDQAVPIFVDGIHFGLPAQVKLAFLDAARVEILKGPQPVFFGMNATAGAFNIISRGPTPEWEGYLDTEFGNNSTGVFNGAFGGPISDTVGIRVAGRYESADGFITDAVTGDQLGGYENFGGRVIFELNPSDKLQITFKGEYSEIDKDPEATVLCLTDGSLLYRRNGDGNTIQEGLDYFNGGGQGNERSIWAPLPQGVGWSQATIPLRSNCASDLGDVGISNGGPFFAPPDNIREENSNFGAIDARAAVDEWVRIVGASDGLDDTNETVDSSNGYVDLAYQLSDDIVLNWQTGWSTMNRTNSRDNSNSPFLLNYQNRDEDFDQYSSELRFTSSGEGSIEWMAGLFWQKTDLDFISNSPRVNVRRGLRYNRGGEDVEWKAVFATLTFNFMDDKASIDLGGRYTDLDKIGFIRGWGAQWVFDVFPCNPDFADTNPATCTVHDRAVQITEADTEFLLPGADTSNLWAITAWQRERDAPSSWIGGRAAAVGMTALDPSVRNGPTGLRRITRCSSAMRNRSRPVDSIRA
jgi:outer membrane receptor protein involved in Fe transport